MRIQCFVFMFLIWSGCAHAAGAGDGSGAGGPMVQISAAAFQQLQQNFIEVSALQADSQDRLAALAQENDDLRRMLEQQAGGEDLFTRADLGQHIADALAQQRENLDAQLKWERDYLGFFLHKKGMPLLLSLWLSYRGAQSPVAKRLQKRCVSCSVRSACACKNYVSESVEWWQVNMNRTRIKRRMRVALRKMARLWASARN